MGTTNEMYYPRCDILGMDPLLYALRVIYSGPDTPNKFVLKTLVSSISHSRAVPLGWTKKARKEKIQRVKKWLNADEILRAWANSDRCLASPPRWPDAILPAFRYRLIPSPYELANVYMGKTYIIDDAQVLGFFYLLLYSAGFTVSEISRAREQSENTVISYMHSAVQSLFTLPQFLLWASATDFRRALLPPFCRRGTIPEKKQRLDTLIKNPFLMSKAEAARFVESPQYTSYLVFGSPKRPRLTPSCRVYRTIEAPYV